MVGIGITCATPRVYTLGIFSATALRSVGDADIGRRRRRERAERTRKARGIRAQSAERQSAELEDEGTNAHNTKAEIVVTKIGIVEVAIRATSVASDVAPRTTTHLVAGFVAIGDELPDVARHVFGPNRRVAGWERSDRRGKRCEYGSVGLF